MGEMEMKTLWKKIGFVFLSGVLLAGCGNEGDSDQTKDQGSQTGAATTQITIGASNTPHAEILEFAKPLLAKEGIDLKIETYSDYVIPNVALHEEDIDANYFQHLPFFEEAVAENNYEFTNLGAVHIEPMGAFSNRHESLADLPEGAKILASNSVTDHGRVITILRDAGLVEIAADVDILTASFDDIVENPKNLVFDYEYDPALMPTLYTQDEGDVIFINSNFAVDHDIHPVNDSIALEDVSSPYANIIAIRSADEDNEVFKKLVEILQSQEVADFILEKWDGAVVPVAGK